MQNENIIEECAVVQGMIDEARIKLNILKAKGHTPRSAELEQLEIDVIQSMFRLLRVNC